MTVATTVPGLIFPEARPTPNETKETNGIDSESTNLANKPIFFGLSTTIKNLNGVIVWFGVRLNENMQMPNGKIKIIIKDEFNNRYIDEINPRDPNKLSEFTTMKNLCRIPPIDKTYIFKYNATERLNLLFDTKHFVTIEQENQVKLSGSFTTFPEKNKTKDQFVFNFISCTDERLKIEKGLNDETEMTIKYIPQLPLMDKGFQRMVQQISGPDNFSKVSFFLHLGDIFYPLEVNRKGDKWVNYASQMWTSIFYQRVVPSIKEVYSRIPLFLTWDDHDHIHAKGFGGDDPGKTNENRKQLSNIFKYISSNCPPDGIYYSFEYSKCGFFMIDTRSNRKKDTSSFLGKKQWEWLEQGIKKNKESGFFLNFICTSSPLFTNKTAKKKCKKNGVNNNGDNKIDYSTLDKESNWEPYEGDINRLHKLAHDYRNIVFLTGDIHRCKYELCYFEKKMNAKIAHKKPISVLPYTQYLQLYSSGIGKYSAGAQSYLSVLVYPSHRRITIKQFGDPAFCNSQGYKGEIPFPNSVNFYPNRNAENYIVENK